MHHVRGLAASQLSKTIGNEGRKQSAKFGQMFNQKNFSSQSKKSPSMDWQAKHFGPSGSAVDVHHKRLKDYFVKKNTFAESLPSQTTNFSIVKGETTYFPSPHVTETVRHGKIGVMGKPQETGPHYMAFKNIEGGGKHFVEKVAPKDIGGKL